MCCRYDFACILPGEYSLTCKLLPAFASLAIRNMLGRSVVFQTLIYGAQANVISSNETLLCAYMKCRFNFGHSKWDVKFPNKQF